jgi:hypothetical protein
MNEATKQQSGSPSRDLFKRKHKDLNKHLWSCDVDFVFIEKHPSPDIVAVLDFKNGTGDDITFSEVIAYNAIIRRGIPVYIVTGDPELGAFTIFRYEGGHHVKPEYKLRNLCQTQNWQEFEDWEVRLRNYWKSLFSPGVGVK